MAKRIKTSKVKDKPIKYLFTCTSSQYKKIEQYAENATEAEVERFILSNHLYISKTIKE